MLPTVDFNCEVPLGAKEVQDVGAELVLAAEFHSGELSAAQMAPEGRLGIC
jgi:hypothetical protein